MRGFRIGYARAVRISGDSGSYAKTGNVAALLKGYRSAADQGSYAVSGQSATLTGSFGGSGGALASDFQITSSVGGTNLPFALGHSFKQGDVPSGQIATTADASSWQCTVKSTWPDGSAKFAILSGRKTLTAGIAATITLTAASPTGGTALTTADLKTQLTQAVTVDAGAFGSATWSGTDWDSPFQTWISGPVMSSWIYRKQIGSDAYLTAWLEVRLFAGGSVEVFPWVENTSMYVAGITNRSATYSFTMGGSQRFSQAIDIKFRTRIPLVNTSTGQGGARSFAHWLGTDPDIVPGHNMAYLASTGLIPNYGYATPDSATLNAQVQVYTPNTNYGIASYGAGGGGGALLGGRTNRVDVHACQIADERAYKAMMTYALSGGSWSLHYRDEAASGAKQHQPIALSDYTAKGLFTGTPAIVAGAGGMNVDDLGGFQSWQNYGHLPYLMTGRHWFLDEQQFWLTYRYLWHSPSNRENTLMIAPGSSTRERAWFLRDVAYVLADLPSGHLHLTDYTNAWQNNVQKFYERVISGTRDSAKYQNNALGVLDLDPATYVNYADQGTNAWATYWQLSYLTQLIGHTWNLGLPQSDVYRAKHQAIRDVSYRHAVGLGGDGGTNNWCWRLIDLYVLPYGSGSTGPSWTSWTSLKSSWGSLYDEFALRTPSVKPTATPGATLVDQAGSTVAAASIYQVNWLASLSYAVEHGAPGAAIARSRVLASSNSGIFTTLNNDQSFNEHAITPRTWSAADLPTYLSGKAVLEWTSLTGIGSTSGIQPGGSFGTAVNVVNAWGGGTMRQKTAQFILHGGGHGDYAGNEIYSINLLADAPVWSRIWGPTPFAQVTGTPYYADGNPSSAHTYYYLQWDEVNDRLMRVKGGPGWTVSGTTSEVNSWPYGATNWNPDGTHPDLPSSNGSGPGTCRDPVTGHIFVWDSFGRSRWSPDTNTWVLSNNTSAGISTGENGMTVDTLRNRVVSLGGFSLGSNALLFWDIATNAVTTDTASGTGNFASQLGVAYDPVNDCIWYVGTDSVLRKYDCATNTCSAPTTTGTGPLDLLAGYDLNKGYFNRFQYSHLLRALVMQPAWTSPTFVIRTS